MESDCEGNFYSDLLTRIETCSGYSCKRVVCLQWRNGSCIGHTSTTLYKSALSYCQYLESFNFSGFCAFLTCEGKRNWFPMDTFSLKFTPLDSIIKITRDREQYVQGLKTCFSKTPQTFLWGFQSTTKFKVKIKILQSCYFNMSFRYEMFKL